MVYALGYDIGGANTKAAFIYKEKGKVPIISVASEYFPIWKQPDNLSNILVNLKEKLKAHTIDVVGLTMTAELSDAYQTKREGVNNILSCVKKEFPLPPLLVLDSKSELISPELAKKEPIRVASANWTATGWLIGKHISNGIVVDVGSTTTSIIPIVKGKNVAKGKTDLEKLACGELIYTGSLRTNIAAITNSVPIRNEIVGLSSELFATTGDVHLLLGHITKKDYSCETTDKRGKTKAEAMARLARIVCADTEMLTKQEIIDIAKYIYNQQINQIAEGLTKVYTYTNKLAQYKVPVITTGMGKTFLAEKAAKQIDIDKIFDIEKFLPKQVANATPAVAVALMSANKLDGEPMTWP